MTNGSDAHGATHSRRQVLAMMAGVTALGAGSTFAQTWPSQKITIVVPFPPGGASDGSARVLAEVQRPRRIEDGGKSLSDEELNDRGGRQESSRDAGSDPQELREPPRLSMNRIARRIRACRGLPALHEAFGSQRPCHGRTSGGPRARTS